MKFLKKFVLWFVIVIAIMSAVLYVSGYGYVLSAVGKVYFHGHTTAFLDDYTEFENRTIPKSHTPQPWPIARNYNAVKPTAELEKWHQKLGTVAFLIIKNDSIVSASSYDGY